MLETIQSWSKDIPYLFFPLVALIAFLLFRTTRFILARLAYKIALQTKTIYDDLIVDRLQPFRFAWLLPLILIYFYSEDLFHQFLFVKTTALILIIWFTADLIISILDGINDVYKNNPRYTGVSVAGYIGIIKVLAIVAAIILTISFLTDSDVVTLISGIGAWLAVLLLIFRDTILSFLASIQISTQKLIKEGDMVDIPAYGASGTITEIDLQMIKIQNFDNTITSIPTSKVVETGFKNYRIMLETGARRFKRSMLIDVFSIKFLDDHIIRKLSGANFIKEKVDDLLQDDYSQITNLDLFIHYIQKYLKNKKEVRLRRYPFLIRALEHTPEGLPIEIYIFVKVPTWEKFEELQTEIMIHLFASLRYFDLQSFQED